MNKRASSEGAAKGEIIEFEELRRAKLATKLNEDGGKTDPAEDSNSVSPDPREMLEEMRRLGEDLRRTLRDLPDALDTVTHQTMAPPLQSLTMMLSGLEGRLQGLEDAVIQQDNKQRDVLQAHMTALAMRLDGMQKRLDHLEKRMHDLLDALVRQNDSETEMFVEALNGRFNGVIALLERVDMRLSGLEQQHAPAPPTRVPPLCALPTSLPALVPPVPSPTPPVAPVVSAAPSATEPTYPDEAATPSDGIEDRRKPWWRRKAEATQEPGEVVWANEETVPGNSYRDLTQSEVFPPLDDENLNVMPTRVEQRRRNP